MTWSMACGGATIAGRARRRTRRERGATPLPASLLRRAHLHGEVEGHELNDGPQLLVGGAGGEAGEARLGDRRVDHARGAKLP